MPTREQVRRLLDSGLNCQAAADPKYAVVPQRQRPKERAQADGPGEPGIAHTARDATVRRT